MRTLILSLTTVFLVSCAPGQNTTQPIETGTVEWLRDHDRALQISKQSGKPVFLLFQEVPGCHGCRQFGIQVLSDDKIVKSIETDFVPLLIHNNSSGRDADLLKKYNEPSWNYQVIRFLDSEGKDLIPRKDRVWTKEALVPRMLAALKKANRKSDILSAD